MLEKLDQEAERTMTTANFETDFRLSLTLFATPDLERLHGALAEGQVLSGLYKLGGKRCLFGWLAGWKSRRECLTHDYPSKQHFLAVRRTIRAFDRGLLPQPVIAHILGAVLAERAEMNRREEETRQGVLSRLSKQFV